MARTSISAPMSGNKIYVDVGRAGRVRSRASMRATGQANVANTGRAVAYSGCTRHKNHLLIKIDILAVYINVSYALNAQFVFSPVVLHKRAVFEVNAGNILLVGIGR